MGLASRICPSLRFIADRTTKKFSLIPSMMQVIAYTFCPLELLYGTHKIVGSDVKPVPWVRTIATFDVPRIFSALPLNSVSTYLSMASNLSSSTVTRFSSLLNSRVILLTLVVNSSNCGLRLWFTAVTNSCLETSGRKPNADGIMQNLTPVTKAPAIRPTIAPATGGRLFVEEGCFAFAMDFIRSLDQAKQCVRHIKMCARNQPFTAPPPLTQTISAPDDAPGFHDSRFKFPPPILYRPDVVG